MLNSSLPTRSEIYNPNIIKAEQSMIRMNVYQNNEGNPEQTIGEIFHSETNLVMNTSDYNNDKDNTYNYPLTENRNKYPAPNISENNVGTYNSVNLNFREIIIRNMQNNAIKPQNTNIYPTQNNIEIPTQNYITPPPPPQPPQEIVVEEKGSTSEEICRCVLLIIYYLILLPLIIILCCFLICLSSDEDSSDDCIHCCLAGMCLRRKKKRSLC